MGIGPCLPGWEVDGRSASLLRSWLTSLARLHLYPPLLGTLSQLGQNPKRWSQDLSSFLFTITSSMEASFVAAGIRDARRIRFSILDDSRGMVWWTNEGVGPLSGPSEGGVGEGCNGEGEPHLCGHFGREFCPNPRTYCLHGRGHVSPLL